MIAPFHWAPDAHNLECKRMSNLRLAGKVSKALANESASPYGAVLEVSGGMTV